MGLPSDQASMMKSCHRFQYTVAHMARLLAFPRSSLFRLHLVDKLNK